MQRYFWGLPVMGFLAAWTLTVSGASAQAPKLEGPKQAEIVTVDQVELRGKFFPGPKAKETPCVLMLHALGENENSTNKEWLGLAKALQGKGYAVLTFDFRGHGESKTVKPGVPNANPQLAVKGFWDETQNQQYVKGLAPKKPRPTEIAFKDFSPAYYTYLVNDIAAAKAYLDERNDAGECNSGDIVLVGAKDGATLGVLWLNSEWQRYRFVPGNMMMQPYIDRKNPEGQAVSAAVWLSLAKSFGKNKATYKVDQMLEIPAKIFKTPMMFLYGELDDAGKKVAMACEKYIRGTMPKEYPFTAAVKVEGAERDTGRELLLEDRDTTKQIIAFLDGAFSKKMVPHKMRVNKDDFYIWQWGPGNTQQQLANQKGNPQLVFNGYLNFLK
jgi:hypothetical protein